MTWFQGRGDGLRRPATVLVTGGCGFIGHHFVQRLLACGHRVSVLDDLSTGTLANLPARGAIAFHRASILDRAAVAAAARGADLVVHLAGIVGMRLAAHDPETTYATSAIGTHNVLQATQAPTVLVSSSAVYGLDGRGDAREAAALSYDAALAYDGGRRGYAVGKWSLESQGQEHARRGRLVMIVRPFNVVGSGQSGRHGMVLPRFLNSARRRRPLLIYGDGTQSRCFSDVRMFVDVVERLVRTPAAWSPAANVVNIGNPAPTTILDLARLVLEVTGAGVPLRFVPYESVFPGKSDVHERRPDVTRLHDLVGPVAWADLRALVTRLWNDGAPAPAAHLAAATPAASDRREFGWPS